MNGVSIPDLVSRRAAAVPRVGGRAPRVGRWGSWRVPERMAERVRSVHVGDPEHSLARSPGVVDDDLGLPGVAVPFERDRETVVVARVEFNEHGGGSFWRRLKCPRFRGHRFALGTVSL